MTPPLALEVEGGAPLRGDIAVPGDKSISHRAVLLASLAQGTSVLTGLSEGDDVARTLEAARALGVKIDQGGLVHGGVGLLREPSGPIYMGNSGTGMRLLAGLVASLPWTTELSGDESLSSRPMDRIAGPLREMGASVEGRGESVLPPISVTGAELRGIDYTVPMASAQVKSCILIAALGASGETVVREDVLTRVHTEELLRRCGADVEESFEGSTHVVRVRASRLEPFELRVPGDPSQAAFWVVAGSVVPGSSLTVTEVYAGPARSGFVDVLERMGARIERHVSTGSDNMAQTIDLSVQSSSLRATTVDAREIPSLDEVPALAVAAALADGTTVFKDMGELRVKESDRLAAVHSLVRAFGAGAEIDGDDLYVTGADHLDPAVVDPGLDHRIAMAAAVAGLAARSGRGRTRILGWEAVATSYPAFAADLATLGGVARSRPS